MAKKKKPAYYGGRAVDEAVEGGWAEVVKGPHKGRYGVLLSLKFDDEGVPTTGLFRTRDNDTELFTVDYFDLKASVSGKEVSRR